MNDLILIEDASDMIGMNIYYIKRMHEAGKIKLINDHNKLYMMVKDVENIISKSKQKKCTRCSYIGQPSEFKKNTKICKKCSKQFHHEDYIKRSQKKPTYYARKVRERNGII